MRKTFIEIVLLMAVLVSADEITKTFQQGAEGYSGYESVTITDSLYEEKFSMYSPWINNGFNKKNECNADVSDLIC